MLWSQSSNFWIHLLQEFHVPLLYDPVFEAFHIPPVLYMHTSSFILMKKNWQ